MRYAVLVDRGCAGAPEALIVGDRALAALALFWLALFTGAAYL